MTALLPALGTYPNYFRIVNGSWMSSAMGAIISEESNLFGFLTDSSKYKHRPDERR